MLSALMPYAAAALLAAASAPGSDAPPKAARGPTSFGAGAGPAGPSTASERPDEQRRVSHACLDPAAADTRACRDAPPFPARSPAGPTEEELFQRRIWTAP